MAQDEKRDDLDRNEPETGEDERGIAGDDEFEEDEDTADVEDEEQYDADERPTGEIGSEGGSPGETVTSRRDRTAGVGRGSEGTTTTSDEPGKRTE